MWVSAGQAATIGIFLLLFGGFLYIGRAILLPMLAAAVVALTLAPLIKAAKRHGISPWITGILILRSALGALAWRRPPRPARSANGSAARPKSAPPSSKSFPCSISRSRRCTNWRPAVRRQRLRSATRAAPNVVLPVVAFLTPAAGELLLFFGTLYFFLVGQIELRNHVVSMFGDRDAKLRFLKIMKDIERNLAGYLTVVTIINAALGVIVAVGAWLIGLPNPAIFGLLAALLNYVPYVGPAVMVVVLFAVGLVTFPSLSHALHRADRLIALTTAEGHFVTPTIVGRRLTLNPLLVFLALAFWTWMWGPFGALLAAPLSIIGLVIVNHLFPTEDVKLPD